LTAWSFMGSTSQIRY